MNFTSQEDFINKAKLKASTYNDDLEKELNQMMKDDPDLKDLKNDSLDELEKEENLSDDELKALEKSMDNDTEKEKPKQKEKTEKEGKEKKKEEEIKYESIKEKKDKYPSRFENVFHRIDKFMSMGVIESETELIDKIILYKKEENLEGEIGFYETRKIMTTAQGNKIRLLVENGVIDIQKYKEQILNQKKYELSIIEAIKGSDKVNEDEKEFLIQRIEERIKIIDYELSQEQVEEEEEEEKEKDENGNKNENENKNNDQLNDNKEILDVKEDNQSNIVSEVKEVTKEKEVKKVSEVKPVLDPEIGKLIENKIEIYKKAMNYFLNNNLTDQAQDAKTKLMEISKIKEKYNKGSTINEYELPLDITPDYISNCSSQERAKKYYTLAKDFSDRKAKLNEDLQDFLNKVKLLEKRQLEKSQASIKQTIEQKKKKVEVVQNIIQKLLSDQKNPWIPCPLFSYEEEEEKVEVINENIKEYVIAVSIGKNTYDKSSTYIHLEFQVSDKKKIDEYIYPKTDNEYGFYKEYQIEKLDFKRMYTKSISFTVYKSR